MLQPNKTPDIQDIRRNSLSCSEGTRFRGLRRPQPTSAQPPCTPVLKILILILILILFLNSHLIVNSDLNFSILILTAP